MSEAPVECMADHRPAVRAFVRGLVGGDALAEDLTQEAFVRAQRAQATRRGGSRCSTTSTSAAASYPPSRASR